MLIAEGRPRLAVLVLLIRVHQMGGVVETDVSHRSVMLASNKSFCLSLRYWYLHVKHLDEMWLTALPPYRRQKRVGAASLTSSISANTI